MKLAVYFQILFFVALLSNLANSDQEVDDHSEFSYDEDSENGPAHWGEIRPEWKKCSVGKMQSPIDITNERVDVVPHLGPLDICYNPSNSTLINQGHDMMMRFVGGAGHIQIHGTKYELKQIHWHSPSEHAINGKRFDLELHMVHQTKYNDTAVVAILYKIGRPDYFLSMIKCDLEAVKETINIEKLVGIIDPRLIKFDSRSYYRYLGSLTTPPCTEKVVWTIVRKVGSVSKKQVELIRDAIHGDLKANARPIQPINKRRVKVYIEDCENCFM